MQRACFLLCVCVGRCSLSKEIAIPFLIFVTTAGSQNGLFIFVVAVFQVLDTCKEDSSKTSLSGAP